MITAGEVLKNKRETLGKSLDQVSLDTKIQKRFLSYIEENKFSYFDSEVFLTGFIKIYAKYLGLDTNKILALYRRSNPSHKENPTKKRETTRKKESMNGKKLKLKFLNPKSLTTVILSVFLLSIVGYVGFQIYKFQTPPNIDISQPLDESEFTTEDIVVKGSVENDSVLEINDKPIEVNEDGTFEKEIKLKEGSNIITVRARKNRNNTLETVETIRVTYLIRDEEELEEIEDDDQTPQNKLTLEIIDSPAWIRLDLDNENKLSQVVEPSELEYTFFDNMYIITGRVSNTNIYWNNELVEWKPTQRTGVAELTCQIVEQELICD
jgi:transcriptional regulator with XRE-family HTH domain